MSIEKIKEEYKYDHEYAIKCYEAAIELLAGVVSKENMELSHGLFTKFSSYNCFDEIEEVDLLEQEEQKEPYALPKWAITGDQWNISEVSGTNDAVLGNDPDVGLTEDYIKDSMELTGKINEYCQEKLKLNDDGFTDNTEKFKNGGTFFIKKGKYFNFDEMLEHSLGIFSQEDLDKAVKEAEGRCIAEGFRQGYEEAVNPKLIGSEKTLFTKGEVDLKCNTLIKNRIKMAEHLVYEAIKEEQSKADEYVEDRLGQRSEEYENLRERVHNQRIQINNLMDENSKAKRLAKIIARELKG